MIVKAAIFYHIKNIISFAALLFVLGSCTVVKNYPKRTPFVYEAEVEVHGDLGPDDRKTLESELRNQLHDSIGVRKVQKLIGWEKGPRFFYSELRTPPVYDSVNADKSATFMQALLHSLGYYRDSINYNYRIDSINDQYRTIVHFNVLPGKRFRLDSIAINLPDTNLQRVTLNARNESLLKKGEPFAIPLISTEFDRLTEVYRNNGYLRFSKEELLAVWDTVGIALLQPTLDPFQQAEQLEALARRRENPTADVEITLRANPDSSHLIKYHVGDITVYPDLNVDTALYIPDTVYRNGIRIISYYDLFKPRILTENIYLNKGDLYQQRNYLKTLNRFNALGSWRLSSIDPLPRAGTDTVDFNVKLTPAQKYIFDANIEGSQNWGSPVTAGNLIGVNFSLQDRNFAKRAIQGQSSLRFGTELNPDRFVQTRQISFGHSYIFPRFVPRIKWKQVQENTSSSLILNANIISRKDFLNLSSINTSWGYTNNWKNKILTARFPNIEYSVLEKGKLLDSLINANRSYEFIFSDGLVLSTIFGYTFTNSKKNHTTITRFSFEPAGILAGLGKPKPGSFLYEDLYRFLRFDVDYRRSYKIRRTQHAFRVFGGLGYSLPYSDNDSLRKSMPFFKAYFAGGANSMRAWGLRKLGPGSTVRSFDRTVAPDRFGDLQLEFNYEYRFYLTTIRGIVLNSALFTDMGNVWLLREDDNFIDGAFQFDKLWHDLAIGAGTGLRVDFGFFLVRLDYAYKLKDPSPSDPAKQNKFFPDKGLFDGQLQLGVTYPF